MRSGIYFYFNLRIKGIHNIEEKKIPKFLGLCLAGLSGNKINLGICFTKINSKTNTC